MVEFVPVLLPGAAVVWGDVLALAAVAEAMSVPVIWSMLSCDFPCVAALACWWRFCFFVISRPILIGKVFKQWVQDDGLLQPCHAVEEL
jgi:hypothetical protein